MSVHCLLGHAVGLGVSIAALLTLPSPQQLADVASSSGNTKLSGGLPWTCAVAPARPGGPSLSPLSTHTVQGTQHMLRPHLELSCPRSHSQSADKLTLHTWAARVPSYTSQTLQSKALRHRHLWLGQHPMWHCRHPLLHALCPLLATSSAGPECTQQDRKSPRSRTRHVSRSGVGCL